MKAGLVLKKSWKELLRLLALKMSSVCKKKIEKGKTHCKRTSVMFYERPTENFFVHPTKKCVAPTKYP